MNLSTFDPAHSNVPGTNKPSLEERIARLEAKLDITPAAPTPEPLKDELRHKWDAGLRAWESSGVPMMGTTGSKEPTVAIADELTRLTREIATLKRERDDAAKAERERWAIYFEKRAEDALNCRAWDWAEALRSAVYFLTANEQPDP